ncbi:helix-turn-helix transcriptional regulator [Streptomyces malaysiensis]|uniref:AraC family transcriptional regulator n=1 Tax=Streptomyces malaysiensis subsp. samsunensis TaxID=459658 RepID=A0A9X2M5U0_STRMQ|nr:AraC family transcriptional regulator [Streptomyces samsunensis]MCQ8836296.1 AraC family transcriptional regulator [Streptomyces samsunensis]
MRVTRNDSFRNERHSTEHVAPQLRTGYWSDLVRRVHCPMDIQFSDHDDYHGLLQLKRSAHNQVVRWRSLEQLDIARRADSGEQPMVQIITPLRGRFRKEQDGRSVVCEPGLMTIIDQARAYRFSQPGPLTAVMLTVPTADLVTAFGRQPRTAVPLDIRSGLGRIVQSMLSEVAEADRLSGSAFDLACAHLMGLLTAAIDESGELTESTREAHRRAILHHVRTHLGNPELGTGHVAAALHLSPRYVQTLLQETGTTMRDHVRTTRLEAARSLLELTQRPIGDIARSCGFTDASRFSTQFRAAYGMSPREARVAHTSQAVAS